MRFNLNTIFRMCVVTMLCSLPLGVGAATLGYDMIFKDPLGNTIGTGALTYDDAIKEDLYIDDRDRQCIPGEFFCEYYGTWTPVISLAAEIQGVDIFAYGSNTLLWMEGHYSYHGRYEIGGYRPGLWYIGDIYFGRSQFQTTPPPLEPTAYTADFLFASVDQLNFGISGQLTYVPTVIPLSPTHVYLGLSILCLLPFSRRLARVTKATTP